MAKISELLCTTPSAGFGISTASPTGVPVIVRYACSAWAFFTACAFIVAAAVVCLARKSSGSSPSCIGVVKSFAASRMFACAW